MTQCILYVEHTTQTTIPPETESSHRPRYDVGNVRMMDPSPARNWQRQIRWDTIARHDSGPVNIMYVPRADSPNIYISQQTSPYAVYPLVSTTQPPPSLPHHPGGSHGSVRSAAAEHLPAARWPQMRIWAKLWWGRPLTATARAGSFTVRCPC